MLSTRHTLVAATPADEKNALLLTRNDHARFQQHQTAQTTDTALRLPAEQQLITELSADGTTVIVQ